MSRYIAFDVETPNRFSDRMSAIGISVIENGVVADSYYSLVNPETHFDYFNVQLTGISEACGTRRPSPRYGRRLHRSWRAGFWSRITPCLIWGC